MSEPPDEPVRAVDVGKGRKLVVRHGTEADAGLLVSLYERLSPRDLLFRFFEARPPLEAVARRWASVASRGGLLLIAEVSDEGRAPTAVAEAGYALRPDGDGELAITVAPDWRGWLGPWLLDLLAEQAAGRGLRNLYADVLVGNHPMFTLLRHRGMAAVEHDGWQQTRLVVSTTGHTPEWPRGAPEGPRVLAVSPGGRWKGEAQARDAGFEVRTCPGPGGPMPRCPSLRGEPCPLVDGADALVFTLPSSDPAAQQVLDDQQARHPDLTIVSPAASAATPSSHPPCTAVAEIIEELRRALDVSGEDEGSG